MEKEFVPYEQALALKELGFDEKCGACYYKKFDNAIESIKKNTLIQIFIFSFRILSIVSNEINIIIFQNIFSTTIQFVFL